MGWRVAFFTVTSLFTKPKVVADADAIGAGDGDPEIKKNDEKSVVQGGGHRTAEAQPAGRGNDANASVVAAPELKLDVHICTSSTDMANDLSAAETNNDDAGEAPPEQQRRMRQRILVPSVSGGSDSTPMPWQLRHLFRRLSNTGSAFQDRLARLIARSSIHEIRPAEGQSTSTKRQRLHELAKKTIPLKSVLLVPLFAYEPSYSGNMWFMMSLQACILAFVTDILSAVTLINLTTVPVCWHCFLACFSSVSMTLVPYFLLVSMNKLSAYVILAAPVPVAAAALVNCVWARARADEVDDSDTLDHVFDVSSAVTSVAAGGGLTGTIFGHNMMSSQQQVVMRATGPLGFLLFFTINLGVYLMLVAMVRPKALTRHAERLVYILLALLAATAVVAAVEFVGWRLACAVASIDVVEAAVSAVQAKVQGAAAAPREVDAARWKKEQRLTSIVIGTVLFTLVMQLHSQKVTAIAGDGPGQSVVLRMLLYLAAFLWSFNRMLFVHEESSATRGGGGAAGVCAWLWSVVQSLRTTVVVLAVLDHAYYNYYQ